ncbi:MAG: DNA repair protein RecN [Clostridia bacterium]|nr:DNA repair protein RecN [Clostridia bacterium]
MISSIYIKNVALISEAQADFDEGLNVLSGETGSGKSVILDSLNFVLGSKADKSMIRYGEKEAFVRAEFSVPEDSDAAKALSGMDIDTDGTIVISRKFTADGKSSIKVNGCTVSASMLKTVTQKLVDVHGQSEHFYLLEEANQLKVIDDLCGSKGAAIKAKLSDLIAEKKEIKAKIASIGGSEQERAIKADNLKYAIDEITRADVREGEFDELQARRKLLDNLEKIFNALESVRSSFGDDNGVTDSISVSRRLMNSISDLSDEYSGLADRLESLYADAEDILECVDESISNLTFDEHEAEEIDERIALLKKLRKKYGFTEADILAYLEDAKQQYDLLANSEQMLEELNTDLTAKNDAIYKLCRELTDLRKKTSETFCKDVVKELKTLNIAHAQFEVNFKDYDQSSANLDSSNGSDKIAFYFSANKGEVMKPLSKVISGGEMSRFMLAIKTVLKDLNGISTFVFDEIDSGISGYTAYTVAEKFRAISKYAQILAVSHLPQVCASADRQFKIYKTEEGDKTYTRIIQLSEDDRVDEIIRLTGGVVSDAARTHAIELLQSFKERE